MDLGPTADDTRKTQSALDGVPQASRSVVSAKLSALESEMTEALRRIEEISRTARDTVRDLQQELTGFVSSEDT